MYIVTYTIKQMVTPSLPFIGQAGNIILCIAWWKSAIASCFDAIQSTTIAIHTTVHNYIYTPQL